MLRNLLNRTIVPQQSDNTSASIEEFEFLSNTPPIMVLGMRNRVDSNDACSDVETDDGWIVPLNPNNNAPLSRSVSPPIRSINWEAVYQPRRGGSNSSTGTLNLNQSDDSEQEEEGLAESEETANHLAMSPHAANKTELGLSPRQQPLPKKKLNI